MQIEILGGPLWTVEGHWAQLTLRHLQTDYSQGICVEVSEEPSGIYFKPGYDGCAYNKGLQVDRSIKFLELHGMGRYDTNWW